MLSGASSTRQIVMASSNRAMQAMLFRATAATRVPTNTPRDRVSLTKATMVAGAVAMAMVPSSKPRVQWAPPIAVIATKTNAGINRLSVRTIRPKRPAAIRSRAKCR